MAGEDNRGEKTFQQGDNYESKVVLCFGFCIAFPVSSDSCYAAPPSVSGDVQHCLECHGNKDFSLELPQKEKLPLFIDVNKFKGSVHGSLDCSAMPCRIFRRKASVQGLKKYKGICCLRLCDMQYVPRKI